MISTSPEIKGFFFSQHTIQGNDLPAIYTFIYMMLVIFLKNRKGQLFSTKLEMQLMQPRSSSSN